MAISKAQKEALAAYETMRINEEKRLAFIRDSNNAEDKIAEILAIQAEKLEVINKLKAHQNTLNADQKKQLNGLIDEYDEQTKKLREINNQLRKQKENQDAINKRVEKYSNLLAKGWEYLMQSDKVIKETIKNLGMSGTKAEGMRKSFELSAGHVARMGGGLADIQTIMSGYADETGRARVLSGQMAEDIAAIGLGTGLGIEQATKLGAQFEIMGLDARRTNEFVQGIVDTSERMGVNTTKVLKNINDNFKKINTYNFKGGSEAIAKMAMDAEKFKVSITSALDAAEATRTLEGAIEAVANLQVMGGEFAKLDMFETMYMSRNEPEKWNQKISEMTKGLVTFKRQSDGTFQKFISPADRDRLEYAAKALGISKEEITEIAQRRGELDAMSGHLDGRGLTGREKELIEGAAVFNAKSGKFEVQLAGRMQDITTLTSEQAKSFAKESVSLKDRAKNAMDFETAFKATIEELKATLLPMLRGINQVLAWIRPIAEGFNDLVAKLSKSDFGSFVLKFTGGIMAFGFITNKLLAGLSGKGLGETIATRVSGGGTKTGGVGGVFSRKTPVNAAPMSSGRRMASRSAGKGMMRGGAGVGAAALGIGAGIGAAAAGISLLADSMSKLDEKQAKTLQTIVITLGVAVGILPLVAFGIAAFAPAAAAATVPMLAFGAAVLMVGGGIGLAAAGIGLMGTGLAKLVGVSKGAGKDMLMIGGGIAAIAASLALLNFSGLGLGVFAGVMGLVTAGALATALVAKNMEKMGTAMSGTKEDWIAVQNAITAISNANFKGGGMLADLANLLKKPLKVEFADKNLQVVSDITLNIDGQKFMQKVYKPSTALIRHKEAQGGQSTG